MTDNKVQQLRKGRGRGVWKGREMGKMRGGRGMGGKRAPADFRYSLKYSPPQMLDLSGHLAGREYNVERAGGKGKGEIGKGGVALAPKKIPDMLQFIITKLVYRWKASH